MNNQPFVPYRIGPKTDPVIRELFHLANQSRTTRQSLAKRAGIAVSTIVLWERGNRGRIDMVSACFEALGYELVPHRIIAAHKGDEE